jgi:regulation of enolase protein 1 (concanavalin A-like superfamily)
MKWLNEPALWKQHGETLAVTAGHKTDFWRTTHYGFIRDNGHFYFQDAEGDWIAEVRISARYASLYDQAGLMVRADDRTWLKCGIELVDGVQHVSAVVTREFSDWSVVPLARNPDSLGLRLVRKGPAIEVFYALDGGPTSMLRLAYLSPAIALQVGPMCAAPTGEGFEVEFHGFCVRHV